MDYFRTHSALAQATDLPLGRGISVGQYWERRRALGVLPFWLFFVLMVGRLMRLGVIYGTDVILDGTTLHAWFHHDPEASWSFPKPWKGSTWGYKVHTVLCRWSQLPMMFLVTPANRQELVVAIPLLTLMVICFGFTIQLVRADAGYFTTPIMTFIRWVLGASFVMLTRTSGNQTGSRKEGRNLYSLLLRALRLPLGEPPYFLDTPNFLAQRTSISLPRH